MATERPPTRQSASVQHSPRPSGAIHESTFEKSGDPRNLADERRYVNARKREGYEVAENDFEYVFTCPEEDFQARQAGWRDRGIAQTNPGGRTNVNPQGGEQVFAFADRAQMTPQQLLLDRGRSAAGDMLADVTVLAPEADQA